MGACFSLNSYQVIRDHGAVYCFKNPMYDPDAPYINTIEPIYTECDITCNLDDGLDSPDDNLQIVVP